MAGPIDLTPINEKIVTSQAPQSGVSPGQIAAPFRLLGEALDKQGEAINKGGAAAESLAENLAKTAGENSVTRDDNGNLVVQKFPIIGPASQEYARASRFSYLAQAQPEIENKMTELRLAHPNDPVAFKAAADEFGKTLLAKVNDPSLQGPVRKIIDDNAGQNYRSSLIQADHTNSQNALVSLQSRLTALNEQGASLARQGGTDTPEYAQIHANRAAIYNELTNDPRFKYPKERADLELKANRDQDLVQAVVGNTVRTFQSKKNAADAKEYLQQAFWGSGSEKLNLTPTQRDHGVTEGLKALENLNAEDKAEVAAHRTAAAAYVKGLETAPGTFDPIAHNALASKSRALGDYKTAAELNAAATMVPLWQTINGLPNADRAAVVAQMARGVVPTGAPLLTENQKGIATAIEVEAKRQGVDPALAKGIGYLESKFDPAAAAAGSSAKGVFQFTDATRAKYGQGANVPTADQIVAGVAHTKQNVEELKGFLGRDPTATEAYLAHYQGIAGAKVLLSADANAPLSSTLDKIAPGWGQKVLTANPWMQKMQTVGDYMNWLDRRARGAVGSFGGDTQYAAPAGADPNALLPGQSISGAKNPYVQSLFWQTANAQREKLGQQADAMATNMIDTLVSRRQMLSPEEIPTFANVVIATGRTDLVPKVEQALATHDKAQGLMAGGVAPSVTALRAQLSTVAASGVNPILRDQLNSLDTMVKQGEEAMKKEPLAEGARRQWVQPINPLDTQNPQAAAAELADREKKISVMQHRDASLGALPAVGAEEAQVLKGALTKGDPAVARGLLEALATNLTAENYKATMASDPMREALDGMVRSYDPQRLDAAMGTMDRLWRVDPVGFKATYGDETTRRLQTWQARKDYLPADQMAEYFKRADDPSTKQARVHLAEEAEKKVKDTKPQDVANYMGSFADRNVPFVNNAPPTDALQGSRLVAEYDELFKERYVDTGDADKAKSQAVERLKTVWGTSDVGGGALMRHPPERYYPQVNGSHDWMRADLQASIEKITGKPYSELQPGAEFSGQAVMPTFNWKYRLMPDTQTEADVAAKRLPSYTVMLTDLGTGRESVPLGPDGKAMRYRFDPTVAQTAARLGFNSHREALAAWDEQFANKGADAPFP